MSTKKLYGGRTMARTLSVAVLVALLCSTLLVVPGLTVGEGEPRAEAGVDQDVTRGATILLDATESWSPAGEIEHYEWTVASPHDETVEPTCEVESCRLANFPAPAMGTYEVELEIEDERGSVATDTIYVETEAANEFDVELSGPSETGSVVLSADVDAGNATLERLFWIDPEGTAIASENLSGLGAVYEQQVDAAPGDAYSVVVQAADNRTVTDTWVAPVTDGPSVDDYPYIHGPEELTGEAEYDDDRDRYVFRSEMYYVETRHWLDLEDVTWVRDGESVGMGQAFTADYYAGEHELKATLTYGRADVDFHRMDSVGGDVPEHLGNVSNDETETLTVVANPEPVFQDTSIAFEEGSIYFQYRVEDPYTDVEAVTVDVDGEDVYRATSFEGVPNDDGLVDPPAGASGLTPVTITATDATGQEATVTEYVSLPTTGPDLGDDPLDFELEREFGLHNCDIVFRPSCIEFEFASSL